MRPLPPASSGPRADLCFELAEVLYRLGDLPAARERYFMATMLPSATMSSIISRIISADVVTTATSVSFCYRTRLSAGFGPVYWV